MLEAVLLGHGERLGKQMKRLYPVGFQWRYDSWDPARPYWIDKLTGSDCIRSAVDAGRSFEEIIAGWQAELNRFRALRSKYLIYGSR